MEPLSFLCWWPGVNGFGEPMLGLVRKQIQVSYLLLGVCICVRLGSSNRVVVGAFLYKTWKKRWALEEKRHLLDECADCCGSQRLPCCCDGAELGRGWGVFRVLHMLRVTFPDFTMQGAILTFFLILYESDESVYSPACPRDAKAAQQTCRGWEPW